MTEHKFITWQQLGEPLCAALGLDPNTTRRIVLDVQPNALVVAYVELAGDERLLDIKWGECLSPEVVRTDRQGVIG